MNDVPRSTPVAGRRISPPITLTPYPPLLMGILNITPESFSDGGQFLAGGTPDVQAVAEAALAMAKAGADLIDFGAEATSFHRSGIMPVSAEEQIRRLLGALALARRRLDEDGFASVAISIDTRSAHVAQFALDQGAGIINDVSGGQYDPAILKVAAAEGCPIILMHAWPEGPDQNPAPRVDVIAEVIADLQQLKAAALAAGINARQIILDPGIGFGKTSEDNWRLLREINAFQSLASPLAIGFSRKRITRDILPPDRQDWSQRDVATAIMMAALAPAPVAIHRVHDIHLAQIARSAINRLTTPAVRRPTS